MVLYAWHFHYGNHLNHVCMRYYLIYNEFDEFQSTRDRNQCAKWQTVHYFLVHQCSIKWVLNHNIFIITFKPFKNASTYKIFQHWLHFMTQKKTKNPTFFSPGMFNTRFGLANEILHMAFHDLDSGQCCRLHVKTLLKNFTRETFKMVYTDSPN